MAKIKFLRRALWSANGLLPHKNELIVFSSVNKIDILCVSETHFISYFHFSISYYSAYHTPQPEGKAHEGTAVFI